jgi:hypothetical protein
VAGRAREQARQTGRGLKQCSSNAEQFSERQLNIFAARCHTLAERVAAGQMRLIDAADMLQSAAELSGLADVAGDDVVQRVMADAFTGGRKA